jgi:hypothetical protein
MDRPEEGIMASDILKSTPQGFGDEQTPVVKWQKTISLDF